MTNKETADRATETLLAPVQLDVSTADSVSHSLAVLATVYNYNHWIFTAIRPFLGPSVLEVGAGIGNITQFLLNVDRLCCLEPHAPYAQYLTRRFAAHQNVEVLSARIEDCPTAGAAEGGFDAVVCLNVLEHIADDAGALRTCRRLLKPRGRAIVLVPAMPALFGEMDRAMGHLRRYTARSLRAAFRQAGLRPVKRRYMNVAGALAWWWRGRVRRKCTIPESETRLFDRWVPLISAAEHILPPLFGQSLIMVGENDAMSAGQ